MTDPIFGRGAAAVTNEDGLTEIIPHIEGQTLGEVRQRPFERNGFYCFVDEDGNRRARAVPGVRPGPVIDVATAGAGIPTGVRLEAEITNPDPVRARAAVMLVHVSVNYVMIGTRDVPPFLDVNINGTRFNSELMYATSEVTVAGRSFVLPENTLPIQPNSTEIVPVTLTLVNVDSLAIDVDEWSLSIKGALL